MSVPTVSVVMPTCRRDGLGLIMRALDAQTFRDFEFVLADEVKDRVLPDSRAPVTRVYVPPRDHYAICQTINAGLAAARGELVVFTEDYCVPNPDWLAIHVERYRTGLLVCGGAVLFHDIPRPPDEVEVEDFARYPARTDARTADGYKIGLGDFWFNNLSAPRANLLEVGGFDEALDELPFHGFQDTDLVTRLLIKGLALVWDARLAMPRVSPRTGKVPRRLYNPDEEERFYAKHIHEILRSGRSMALKGMEVRS